jgi:hypothetical protein
MTEMTARIAFIIDGVVQDVLNTDNRLAALFLSQPQLVDVTEVAGSELITYGYTYNQELNTFTAPPLPDTLPPSIVPPGSDEPDNTPVPGITE